MCRPNNYILDYLLLLLGMNWLLVSQQDSWWLILPFQILSIIKIAVDCQGLKSLRSVLSSINQI